MTASCPVHGISPTGCPVSERAAAFDPFRGAYQENPGASLDWARRDEPVFYSPELGYWVVTRYEDVKAVFRDPILFSPSIALEKITPAPAEAAAILDSYGFAMKRTMVNEDEPDHMARRRMLMDAFLPEKLERHEGWVQALTRDYMDRFIDKGRADLVAEMFREIPMTVALRFLGVPEADAAELKSFSIAHTINTWGRPTPKEQLQISEDVGRFWQTAQRILDGMMAAPDGEGWMYDSIRAHFEHPDVVPESYLRSMMMAILVAAHETTSFATANAFRALLSDESAWRDLCANPALIPSAVEECLRLAGSAVAWRRIATAPTEVGGVAIPESGKLLLVQASANVDPAQWENAESLDIYRDNASEHLTFGYGAHQCMGKNIARLEMRAILDEFVRRLPHMRLVPEQEFTVLPNTSFRGVTSVWVEWDPAENPERRDPALRQGGHSYPIGAPRRDDILRRVRVAAVTPEAEGVIRVDLEDPEGRPLPRWTPGAHVDLVSDEIRRKYSLCGAANAPGYSIAILREDAGRGGSRHFHETLRPGAEIQIAGPRNHFRLDESAAGYTLIAGGIGITPVLAMADRLKAQSRPYQLHYCGRGRAHMALLDRALRDHDATLHITAEGTRLDFATLAPEPGTQVYACGPESFLAALEETAQRWPEDMLHIEHFTARSAILDPDQEHAFKVHLKDSDLTLTVARDETLLEALTAAGVDVSSDCCEGLCGTCEIAVTEGDIDHRDVVLSSAERAAGNRLMACCSRAKGKRLVLGL